MIIENSIKDQEACKLFCGSLQDLMLFFPLCGLSYLGEAVEVREDASVGTLCTDGRTVRYSPEWIRTSSRDGRIFDALHEWLHIFFNHLARRGDRHPKIWNIAVDIVVVREACDILNRSNSQVWKPPEDGVIPPDWAKDMTAEQIYDELISKRQKAPKNEEVGTGEHHTSSDLCSPPEEETSVGKEEEFHRKFAEELAQAALIQQQIRGRTVEEIFGSVIGARLDEVLRNSVPWSRLLRGQLLADVGYESPTYSPPRLRWFPELTLPSMRSLKMQRLVILIDVSASVGEKLMGTFKANVVPAAMRANETIIITFDAVVREVVRTKHPRKALDQIKFLTGIHSYTSSVQAFEMLDKLQPKAMTCLTDGFITLPEKQYPKMLWVIPQNGQRQPWGRNFTMEVSW